MSQSLNEIQELFNQSEVDPIMVNDLLVFLPILPEEVLEKLAEIFKEEPELIGEFAINFKTKFEALTGQQSKSIDDLEIEDENDFEDLNDFDNDEDNYDEEEF